MNDAEKRQLLRNLQTTACDIIRDDIRPFPIQAEGLVREPKPHYPKASTIPWWLAEVAYKRYREKYGSQQSLEQIGQRGGFGRAELVRDLRRDEDSWIDSVTFLPDDHLPFPIKGDDDREPCTIPWWLARVAWENYRQWAGATLENMAERGGFTRYELMKSLRKSG